MKKLAIITSVSLALVAVFLPATASAHPHRPSQPPSYHQPRRHTPPPIQVQVTERVPYQMADYQWVWQWDASCGTYGWVYVRVGSHTHYRTVRRWVTAHWDHSCNAYVWYDSNGRRHILNRW